MNIRQIFFRTYLKWCKTYYPIFVGTFVIFLVFYIVSCEGVMFDSVENFDCNAEIGVEGVNCNTPSRFSEEFDVVTQGEYKTPSTVIKSPLGRVNVLFVVDNSPSMKKPLREISKQFDSFLQDIQQTDYNIAIITTDWKNNGGQLIPFSNGKKILSNPKHRNITHLENVELFKKTIQLPVVNQTDERGIYSLNQALDNMSVRSQFFRPHSLFMVIIISDEDERSHGGIVPPTYYGEVLPLEHYDLPDTFFRKVSQQNKYSLVTVHSIIVKPGDIDCAQKINGIEGNIYAQLSQPKKSMLDKYGNIQPGRVVSICDKNYSNQLKAISDSLRTVPPFPLPCIPEPDSVLFKVDGDKVDIRVTGRVVYLLDKVDFGGKATVYFRCQKSITSL